MIERETLQNVKYFIIPFEKYQEKVRLNQLSPVFHPLKTKDPDER